MEIHQGRFTADIDGDFVVFLIGMRFNHPLRIRWQAPACGRKANTAAARIGASTTDEPAVAPY